MKILITGATGLVGSKLTEELVKGGHQVNLLTRDANRANDHFPFPTANFTWKNFNSLPPKEAFSGVEAVVHLMGENIAAKRWSDKQKEKIRHSRVDSTKSLSQAIVEYDNHQIKSFLSTSAIGIYPETDEGEYFDEFSTARGKGFLTEVCSAWEEALSLPETTRLVMMRIGVILSNKGGALGKMSPIFRLGAGGPIGLGRAHMSWIHLDDLVKFIVEAVGDDSYTGVYNLVAPECATNKQFTKALASALGVPALFPVPPLALKVMLGEMSQVVTASQHIKPSRLTKRNFQFSFPSIRMAMDNLFAHDQSGKQYKGVYHLEQQQFIKRPMNEVFEFFSRPENLEQLTPDFVNFKIDKLPEGDLKAGNEIEYTLRIHGFPIKWKTIITEFENHSHFVDIQYKGPYSLWHHRHEFFEVEGGTMVIDRIHYRPPGGFFSFGAIPIVKNDLKKVFAHRRSTLKQIFLPG